MRSLRTRLTLFIVAIALSTVTIVGLGVLASLQESLQREALDDLQKTAQRSSGAVDRAIDRGDPAPRINRLVRDAADQTTSRVTLLGVARADNGVQTYPKSDSTREVEIRDLQFDVAVEAAATGKPVTGTEAGDAG